MTHDIPIDHVKMIRNSHLAHFNLYPCWVLIIEFKENCLQVTIVDNNIKETLNQIVFVSGKS